MQQHNNFGEDESDHIKTYVLFCKSELKFSISFVFSSLFDGYMSSSGCVLSTTFPSDREETE